MTSEQPLPSAGEAEESVLSSILQNPDDYVQRSQELGITADSFSLPQNQFLYGFLKDRVDKELPCGLLEVTQALGSGDAIDNLGGASGIARLYTLVTCDDYFDYNAGIVRNSQALRAVITNCSSAVARASAHGADGIGVLSDAISNLEAVLDGHESSATGKTKHIKELLPSVLSTIEDRIDGKSDEWLPLPWEWVRITRGGCAIVAARPGKGKSAMLENMAKSMAVVHGEATCMVSLEMPDDMLAERALAGESEIQTTYNSKLTKEDVKELKLAITRLSDAPYYISDMPGATADEVISEMRRINRKHGVNTFFIDYIQDIGAANVDEARNKKMRIDNALTKFDVFRKRLTKSTGQKVTHVFAAQSDREADKLEPKDMHMGMLSDSSQLEKIAFQVMFLGPTKETDLTQDVIDMQANVVKNRSGNVGHFAMKFHKRITKWTSG